MANVEFPGKRGGLSLNVTYTDLADEGTVHFEIFTPYGELGIPLTARTVEELHESLGAWLELRKKEKKEKRAAQKQARAQGSGRRDSPATARVEVEIPVVRRES